MAQVIPLVAVELIVIGNVIVGGKQESSRARGGIADGLTRLRVHDIHNGLDKRTRREVLTRAALGILRVLFEQAFVDLTLDVNIQPDPGFAIYQFDQAAQFGGILDFVLRLAEDDGNQPRALTQPREDGAVMRFEIVAIQTLQTRPVVFFGNGALPAEHGCVFRVHFQEQQVGELLDVVAIGHAVVAQDVAVVPKALNDGGGWGVHGQSVRLQDGIIILPRES